MNWNKSTITGGFWGRWQRVNAESAIFHQWDQLEKSGCIDNFRILADKIPSFRQGWFFADSDAYKWLEAAVRILPGFPDPKLKQLVIDFIDLLQRAQDPDGYLYTYNQIHFPGTRWVNLQIEHELYCHGHLIEAGVSRFNASGVEDLLMIARKAADRIVADFNGKGPQFTPGHEEIEIALLRLYEVTQERDYLDMAHQFLRRRGQGRCFGLQILRQSLSNSRRVRRVEKQRAIYLKEHPDQSLSELPPGNVAKKPALITARFLLNALSGGFLQQHAPIQAQTVPVGHAVRFSYLQTATAMLDRLSGSKTHLPILEKSWDHMVTRRMYLTGGIGSLPLIEGFGWDYELHPEFAYTETCAALGSMFWNREMAKLAGDVKYSDLFEWQLYNAALIGMGWDGKAYFYNNPLESHGQVQRLPWYQVPCCPSNLSRTFANLQNDILAVEEDKVSILQYISSAHTFQVNHQDVIFEIESALPWSGEVRLNVRKAPKGTLQLSVRQPAWTTNLTISLNDNTIQTITHPKATSLDLTRSRWIDLSRAWQEGDRLTLNFTLPIQLYVTHKRVKSVLGKAALTCGALVFCLESLDNPDVDIFNVVLNPETLTSEFNENLLGGCRMINALSTKDQILTFIPYHLWGNRGRSEMSVFVKVQG